MGHTQPEKQRSGDRPSAMNLDPKVKLLRHFQRVQGIVKGEFLPPVMVDVDLVDGLCNLDCVWCSQGPSRESRPRVFMSPQTMERLGPFCREWGIRSWRMAGDSEPTLNRNIGVLLRTGYDCGIDMGLTTNGVLLDRAANLHLLTWLGISLDAATAETWSRMKRSPEENFHRIIDNIKRIRRDMPDLEVTIKYVRWSQAMHPGRRDFYPDLPALNAGNQTPADASDNYADAELLPRLAEQLRCKYRIRDAFPTHFSGQYLFERCMATPLSGCFGADHKFHLCCDARNVYVLTDDYTRDDWRQLPSLWGSPEHKDLIAAIVPRNCLGCSKWQHCSVLENVVLEGKYSDHYQLNFI